MRVTLDDVDYPRKNGFGCEEMVINLQLGKGQSVPQGASSGTDSL